MGVAVNFDPRCLALAASSQNFKSKHRYCSVASMRTIVKAIQGPEFTFSGKRLSRNLLGLVAAICRGAVFNPTGSSITEFMQYLQRVSSKKLFTTCTPLDVASWSSPSSPFRFRLKSRS